MASSKKTELYVCNGDSLGERANIRPARYQVDDYTMFRIEQALTPHIKQWRDGAPHSDLNKLLASVYLQGVLDCGLLDRLKRTAEAPA